VTKVCVCTHRFCFWLLNLTKQIIWGLQQLGRSTCTSTMSVAFLNILHEQVFPSKHVCLLALVLGAQAVCTHGLATT